MTAITAFKDFDKPLTGEADRSYTMPARYYLDREATSRRSRRYSSVPGIASGTSRRCALPATTLPSTLPTKACS